MSSTENIFLHCQENNASRLNACIESEEDIESKNSSGETPLICSLNNCSWESSFQLIDMGADVDATGSITFGPHEEYHYCALSCAISRNAPIDLIQKLIKTGANVRQYENRLDINCNSPLYSAVFFQNLSVTKLLVESDADIDAPSGIRALTPLMSAVFGSRQDQSIDTIEYLLAIGADRHLKDADGNTAFEIAHVNNFEFAKKMLKTEKSNDETEPPKK